MAEPKDYRIAIEMDVFGCVSPEDAAKQAWEMLSSSPILPVVDVFDESGTMTRVDLQELAESILEGNAEEAPEPRPFPQHAPREMTFEQLGREIEALNIIETRSPYQCDRLVALINERARRLR